MPVRFFAPSADPVEGRVRLPADEAHHLTKVLRLRAGAAVALFDGRGHEWDGVVETAGRSGVIVAMGAPRAPAGEPPVRVTLGVSLQTGDRMETVVREATALGAAAIVPLSTGHVAVPARARRSTEALARWHRVAVASAKQCGRAVVPAVQPVSTPTAVLAAAEAAAERILMCVEPSRSAAEAASRLGPRPAAALVLVGPEGGWTEAEVALALDRGARLFHLGPRTLRADLAPAVALAVLWASWGW